MATNNLNPIGQSLPPSLPTPTPAPSGMSVLAKLVVGVAALFFAVYICIGISGFISSLRKEDQLNEEQQQEVEKIRPILLGYFDKIVPDQYQDEFQRLATVFTGSCQITAHDIAAANMLLANLSSPPSMKPGETLEESRRLKNQQDREFKEALRIDQQKKEERGLREVQEQRLRARETAMTEALTPLNAEITEATKVLGVRLEALQPLQECWRTATTHACYGVKLGPEETYATTFKNFEERFGVTESLDYSIPKNVYHERVEAFNARFPDEGEPFAQKRATLAKGYQAYSAIIKQVFERLAWVRLKAYHLEVGEEFFAVQFSREFLSKVRNGEELPCPQ